MAAAAALFSVAPLMTALRGAQARSLRSDRTVTRDGSARGVLVAAEVALAIVLLTGATLMGRTLASLYAVDPGFNASQLMTLRVQPPASRSPSQLPAYWSEVLANVRAVPGVTSAATVLHLPMSGRKWQAPIEVEGLIVEPELQTRAAWQVVQGDYLETIGGTLLAGRSFTTADGDSASRVAMISQTLATRVFGAADPLGRRIRAGNATQGNWVTIVGVVSDIRHDSLSAAPPPELYVPFGQRIIYATSLIARTSVDPASLALPLQRAVWAIDASTPIALVKPMQELIDESGAARRFVLGILIAFAALGVALGAIGIYGVVSYGVRQRTREIGVRMALGAAPRAVVALVVQHGMMWAAIGTAAGLAMALLLARYMRSLLFGVATTDTLTFVLVPTTLLVVAAAAAALPALRAARLQPTIALRD
jgi:predicted permease